MTPAEKERLALFSTDDVIAEALSRYDDAIFAGLQERTDGDKTSLVHPCGHESDGAYRIVTRRFRGDTLACIGLSRMISRMVEAAMEDDITPISMEDL